jgi:hypothetical protein
MGILAVHPFLDGRPMRPDRRRSIHFWGSSPRLQVHGFHRRGWNWPRMQILRFRTGHSGDDQRMPQSGLELPLANRQVALRTASNLKENTRLLSI